MNVADSPTKRTLDALRRRGYTVEVVEHWDHYTRRRHDLLGFADVLALRPGETLAVQTTTTGHQANRRHKIQAEPRARAWLEAGNTIHVHGWHKSQPSGRWALTETAITLGDFEKEIGDG